MTGRIVLSALLLFILACGDQVANGIGTSPSYDDDPIEQAVSPLDVPPVCGLWLDVDSAAADARALAGEPPNMLVFSLGMTTCSDAVTIGTEAYPGRFFVRRVRQTWRAYEAP